MDSGKKGKLFAVLMISLIAYGFGSCVNVLNSGNDVIFGILPSTVALDNQQQITAIDDSSFEPVHVKRHYYNSTNSTQTNTTGNNTVNTSQKKSVSGNNSQ